MSGGIAKPPSPRGYEYGTWSSRLWVGHGVDNPILLKKRLLGNQKCGLEPKVHYGGEGLHWAVVPLKKKKNNINYIHAY